MTTIELAETLHDRLRRTAEAHGLTIVQELERLLDLEIACRTSGRSGETED